MLENLFEIESGSEGAGGGHGIESDADGGDAQSEGHLVTAEAIGIAGSIEFFVVVTDDGRDALGDHEAAAELIAEGGVLFEEFELFLSELAGLVKNGVGDFDAADVLKEHAEAEFFEGVVGHPEFAAEEHGEIAQALAAAGHVLVAGFEGGADDDEGLHEHLAVVDADPVGADGHAEECAEGVDRFESVAGEVFPVGFGDKNEDASDIGVAEGLVAKEFVADGDADGGLGLGGEFLEELLGFVGADEVGELSGLRDGADETLADAGFGGKGVGVVERIDGFGEEAGGVFAIHEHDIAGVSIGGTDDGADGFGEGGSVCAEIGDDVAGLKDGVKGAAFGFEGLACPRLCDAADSDSDPTANGDEGSDNQRRHERLLSSGMVPAGDVG